MKMRNVGFALVIGLVFGAVPANADTVLFSQGFETDTAGWLTNGGTVTRVATGSGGIASAQGSFHGVATEGTFTRFGAYSSVWPGTYEATLDIYLDTAWSLGSGFDYAVASSNKAGSHLRDFIFHVTKDTSTGQLLVAGSNNTNFAPREDLETLGNNFAVTQSGWYTFKHQFRDNAGALAVDLMLLSGNTVLFTETRTNPADLIATIVGGNRYGWFTDITMANGLAIDNTGLLTKSVPEPASVGLLGLGLVALVRRVRKQS